MQCILAKDDTDLTRQKRANPEAAVAIKKSTGEMEIHLPDGTTWTGKANSSNPLHAIYKEQKKNELPPRAKKK